MIEERSSLEAVCIKGEVYTFTGNDNNMTGYNSYIQKYSPSLNKWIKLGIMLDGRVFFCACAFVDELFFFGGGYRPELNSCLHFNPKDHFWEEVGSMKEARSKAARAVFQGHIVVSGGRRDQHNVELKLNTVERYDVFADKWSSMPSMIKGNIVWLLLAINCLQSKPHLVSMKFLTIP